MIVLSSAGLNFYFWVQRDLTLQVLSTKFIEELHIVVDLQILPSQFSSPHNSAVNYMGVNLIDMDHGIIITNLHKIFAHKTRKHLSLQSLLTETNRVRTVLYNSTVLQTVHLYDISWRDTVV